MRRNSLNAENVPTFGSFDLDLGRTWVLVWPNGSGKSHITRSVDLVQKTVDSVSESLASPRFVQAADQVLRSYASVRRHGAPPAPQSSAWPSS